VTDSAGPTTDEAVSLIDKTREQAAAMLEKIFAAAQPGAVYGQPVSAEGYTVITAAEVTAGGGFGMGMGTGLGPGSRQDATAAPTVDAAPPGGGQAGSGGGGGGGGGSMGRPVAIIAIGPDGVTIKPVVDVTKVALAGLAAWATMLGLLRARRRMSKRLS
jgi:uncharacterized spore protein YtfJ